MYKVTLTINEASSALGIGRSKLYELIADGKLTPRKLGRRTLISLEELQAFAASLPTKGNAGHKQ